MKRLTTAVGIAAMILAAAGAGEAQQPATPGGHHPSGQTGPGGAPASGGPGSAPGGGQAMPGGGPMMQGAMPMMDMCRQMMAGHHGSGRPEPSDPMGSMMGMGPMMGMMGPGADPKMAAHMMEMRGEMMKAMGEIMMKHGQRMQGASPR